MGSEHVGDQSFSDMWIGGNARVHMGNIYNSPDDGTYEKRLVDWLTSINPSSSHDHACKQYQEGTLSWFFADRRFQKWRDRNEGTSSSVLWCRGEMGTGKTTLIAQILEHLNIRKSCETDSAIVYCRYADRQNQTAENLLGSILAQLYQRIARKFDIPLHVKRCFDKQFSFWTKKPSLGELESWLKWRLENETPVFILLDALDEMEPASRRKLLRSIRSVEHHALRLLVTSRSLPEIGKELWQKEEIWVHAHRQDVVTFISSRLQDDVADEFLDHVLKTPGRQGCLTVKDEILYKVAESAGEMFLSAKLHLDRITGCASVEDIYHYLDNFPPGLETLYEEAWKRATEDRFSPNSLRAKKILLWLTFAEQPLSVHALAGAISVSVETVKRSPLTEEEILAACVGLVHVEVIQGTQFSPPSMGFLGQWLDLKDLQPGTTTNNREIRCVSFVHASAHQHFFDRAHEYFPQAHDSIVSTCASFLDPTEVTWALRFSNFYVSIIL